jgi:hypothetical protein
LCCPFGQREELKHVYSF